MADPSPLRDPMAIEFVDLVLNGWNGDLGFKAGVLEQLRTSSFDVLDLLVVIEDGVTTSLEKESAHETIFTRECTLEDGKSLSVTLSFNPHLNGLTIVGFVQP